MAIRFDCQFCGKTLKADDSKAGKKVKCPSCEGLLSIPEALIEPQIEDSYDEPEFDAAPEVTRPRKAKSKTLCPMCDEPISPQDAICPWCGEKTKKKKRSSFPIADPGKRLMGALADVFATFVFVLPGGILLAASGGPESESPLLPISIILLGLSLLALVVLQLYLLITRSQSIGKYLVKTQIFDYETRQPAGFVKTFVLRGIVNQLIGGIPCVGPIYAITDILFVFSSEHRCLHDQIAGTYVVDIS